MNSPIRYLVVIALMVLAAVFIATHGDHPTPLPTPLAEFPSRIGEWSMISNTLFDQETLDVLRPTQYLARRYQDDGGAKVDLYIGYHDGAAQAGPLHSPKNCLPGSGWYEASSQSVVIHLEKRSFNAMQAEYRRGDKTELFLYWFEVAGQPVTNEFFMKLQEVLSSLRSGRRDACFIRLSMPESASRPQSIARIKAFLWDAYPFIKLHLPS